MTAEHEPELRRIAAENTLAVAQQKLRDLRAAELLTGTERWVDLCGGRTYTAHGVQNGYVDARHWNAAHAVNDLWSVPIEQWLAIKTPPLEPKR